MTDHPDPAPDRRHHERRLTPKLSTARQAAIWTSLAALTATAIAWLYAEYLYAPADDGIEAYAIKHYAMMVHAAFALLFVWLAGTLAHHHMQAAWEQQRNRATGAAMALTAAVLVASGYGLWYFGGETLRAWTEIAHWISGFGIVLVLAVHAWTGRRRR